jgi:PAS domain S-box-containing protein
MKPLPQKLIPITLIGVCLLWLGVSLYSYFSTSALIAAQEAEARTRDVLLRLEELFSDLKDVAIAQRGFVLTGQNEYRDNHDDALEQLTPNLAALRTLMAAQPAQQERLAQLTQLIEEYGALSHEVIEMRRAQGLAAAQALVRTHEGLQVMNEARAAIKKLEAQELNSLAAYEANTGQRARRTINALVAINLLAVLLSGLVFNTLRLSLKSSRRAEGELQQAKANLEARVAERTAALTAANAQLRHEVAEREQGRARLATILESITDGFITFDEQWRFTYLNSEGARTLGRPVAELLGKNLWEEFPELAATSFGQMCQRVLAEGVPLSLEDYYPPFDAWFNARAYPADGGVALFFLDITARKAAEQERRRNAEQLRLITDAVPALISYVDTDRRYRFVNANYAKWFGHETDEITGRHLAEVLGASAYEIIRPQVDAVLQGRAVTFERSLTFNDGGTRYVSINYVPDFGADGEVKGYFALLSDLTEHKQATTALQHSEERYRALTLASTQFIWTADERGHSHERVEWWEEFSGQPATADDLGWLEAIHPDDRAATLAAWQRSLATKEKYDVTYRVRHRTGAYYYFQVRGVPVFNEDGSFREWVGTMTDISEARHAAEQLRESEERFSKAFNASPHLMTITTLAEGRYLAVNEAVLRATGHTREEIIGQRAEDLRVFAEPEGRGKLLDAFRNGVVRDLDIKLRMKDGRIRTVLLSAEIITVNNEQCILTVSNDITEREQAEEAVRRSEERYRAFVAQSSEAIWRFELEQPFAITLPMEEQIDYIYRHGYLAECNDVMAKQYGYASAEEIIGARLGDLMPRTEATNIEYLRQFIAADYRLTEAESHEIDRHGKPRYFLNNLIGIIEDGYLTRAWGTQRDITERKQAEAALRESEERFRTLADSAPVPIWVNDVNAGCEFVNHSYLNFFGKSLAEVQGNGWQPSLHPEDAEQYLNKYLTAFAARQPFHGQTRARRADGQWRWLDSHGLPRFAPSGEFLGYVGSSPDITEIKQAELDAQFLADLSESIRRADDPEELMAHAAAATGAHLEAAQCFFTEVALGADRFTVHGDYHTGATSLVGSYQRSDFGPQVIAELTAGRTIVVADTKHDTRTATAHDNYQRGGIGAFVAAPLLRDGQQVSSLIISAPHARQWTPREINLLETVAERAWLAVEKLRAEAVTARLLAQERRARAEAEAANRSKDEFLAVLSHELRSPLNAIIGWNRILREGRRNDAEIAKTTEIIDRNARTQLQLIEDLLDTARLISGKLKLELQPVALIDVVGAALDVVRPAALAKGIELRTEFALEDSQIMGDPARLQQIVWNLLANSVKFTPAGGHITTILRRAGAQMEIVISDTGKGIKPDFLPHVFDRFAQADGSSVRRYGGLGLGLALVHHLVEMHGGTITASSAGENLGASFTVVLPLRAVTQAVGTAHVSRDNSNLSDTVPAELLSLDGVRALIVDDEDDARELLVTTLKQHGATEVQAVASGVEALTLLRTWTPSVLICDIGLPDEDGYEVLRKVRAITPASNGALKAIALTAFGRAEDRLRALQAGFQMHIAKPVEPTELVVVINTLLGRTNTRSS